MTPEEKFMELADAGKNIFLSGQAGTGKSTLLRAFIESCKGGSLGVAGGGFKIVGRTKNVDVTAPTGIAALNVNGMTIHRYCGMMLGPAPGQDFEEYYHWLQEQPYPTLRRGWDRVREAETLVIDEISMLPGNTLAFVEWLFRRLRDSNESWGGAQVIVVGDFLQLAPVRRDERVNYDWAFKHEVWMRSEFHPVVLKEVKRQSEKDHIAALSGVRRGEVTAEVAMVLRPCVKSFPPEHVPRIYTHNTQVNRRNEAALADIPNKEHVFTSSSWGNEKHAKFLRENLLCPEELKVKVGARVMTLVNHRTGAYVNGSLGTVVDIGMGTDHEGFSTEAIHVQLDSGALVFVLPYTWQAGERGHEGYYRQFPLRLAYAMTVHKSQGISLDEAYIDIRAAREPGQGYVALSRVRTLKGLMLKEWFDGIFVCEDAITFQDSL